MAVEPTAIYNAIMSLLVPQNTLVSMPNTLQKCPVSQHTPQVGALQVGRGSQTPLYKMLVYAGVCALDGMSN